MKKILLSLLLVLFGARCAHSTDQPVKSTSTFFAKEIGQKDSISLFQLTTINGKLQESKKIFVPKELLYLSLDTIVDRLNNKKDSFSLEKEGYTFDRKELLFKTYDEDSDWEVILVIVILVFLLTLFT